MLEFHSCDVEIVCFERRRFCRLWWDYCWSY